MKKILITLMLTLNSYAFSSELEAIEISSPKIKVMPPVSKVTAIYLNIKNSSNKDIALKEVKGSFAESFELHDMSMKDGVMRMNKVDFINIKKQSEVSLNNHGLHIMVFELKSPIKDKDEYEIELIFDNNQTKKIKVIGFSAHHNHH